MSSALFSGVSFATPGIVKLLVNGEEIHSEVPAQIIDGTTMIPARALAEALGAKVSWDQTTHTVIVENEKYRHIQLKKADMSEGIAEGLAADAQSHFWLITRGGDGDHKDGSFPFRGTDYRWMATDLDTKVKFIEYLELLYTPEQTQIYWEKQIDNGSLVEIDGKLAQPNADGGSMTRWNEASAKLVKKESGIRTYRFSVPLYENLDEHDIQMRYIDAKGWRIDEPVETIH